MADKYSAAREKLAERILAEFKDKITGAADEPVVGDNPENRFFVGKLLTRGDDTDSGYGSDVFIESVGADFYVDKTEIQTAEITVFREGNFITAVIQRLNSRGLLCLQRQMKFLRSRFFPLKIW